MGEMKFRLRAERARVDRALRVVKKEEGGRPAVFARLKV